MFILFISLSSLWRTLPDIEQAGMLAYWI